MKLEERKQRRAPDINCPLAHTYLRLGKWLYHFDLIVFYSYRFIEVDISKRHRSVTLRSIRESYHGSYQAEQVSSWIESATKWRYAVG